MKQNPLKIRIKYMTSRYRKMAINNPKNIKHHIEGTVPISNNTKSQ